MLFSVTFKKCYFTEAHGQKNWKDSFSCKLKSQGLCFISVSCIKINCLIAFVEILLLVRKNIKVLTGQEHWLRPIILALGRPRQADHFRSGVQEQPGQRDETPSLLKI